MQQTETFALTRRDAAVALGVSLRTIDTLLARGALQGRRIGRRVLIPKTELVRLLTSDPPAPSGTRIKR